MNKENITRIILVGSILLMLYVPSFTSARPEYAVKESRNCPYCHAKDGPPQLNDIGVYYATHNHSFEGYVPTPKPSPTPEPTKEVEIGVHMNTWNVGMIVFATILLILAIVFAIRL